MEKTTSQKIDEILENTKAVKTVIVKEKQSRGESLKKAQSKFKKVGANLKVEQANHIERYCETLGISVSEYIKRLLLADLNTKPVVSNKPLLSEKPIQSNQKTKQQECSFKILVKKLLGIV